MLIFRSPQNTGTPESSFLPSTDSVQHQITNSTNTLAHFHENLENAPRPHRADVSPCRAFYTLVSSMGPPRSLRWHVPIRQTARCGVGVEMEASRLSSKLSTQSSITVGHSSESLTRPCLHKLRAETIDRAAERGNSEVLASLGSV